MYASLWLWLCGLKDDFHSFVCKFAYTSLSSTIALWWAVEESVYIRLYVSSLFQEVRRPAVLLTEKLTAGLGDFRCNISLISTLFHDDESTKHHVSYLIWLR